MEGSHLASTVDFSFVENGFEVLFPRISCLIRKIQAAERNFELETMIACLDKFRLLILDGFVYIVRDKDRSSVLFELVSQRYEQYSILLAPTNPSAIGIGSSPTRPLQSLWPTVLSTMAPSLNSMAKDAAPAIARAAQQELLVSLGAIRLLNRSLPSTVSPSGLHPPSAFSFP